MKIKLKGFSRSSLNRFDILGTGETALAKALAYLLGVNRRFYYDFLKECGINARCTIKNYQQVSIEIERVRTEGRTDIELIHSGEYHVIVECKVGANRLKGQRCQYLKSFKNEPQTSLVFLTQEYDSNREILDTTQVRHLGWRDVIGLAENKVHFGNEIVAEFVNFANREFRMANRKEILVQDLSDPTELNRFERNCVYKRDPVFGSPLYFAPYFTRTSGRVEGISQLAKVLGVLTMKPTEFETLSDSVKAFSDGDEKLFEKWKDGIESVAEDTKFTFYFLSEPVQLVSPLLKDAGIEKGRGKDWVAGMIPKNRCVTFEEFVRRMTLIDTRS